MRFRLSLRHPVLAAALSLAAAGATMTTVLPAAHAKKKEDDPKKKSPAKTHIQMAEFKMKSITKKMGKDDWKDVINHVLRLQKDLDQLKERIGYIKEKDPAWDTKPYEAFHEEHQKKVNEAHAALEEKKAASLAGLIGGANFTTMIDRSELGGPIAVGFQVVDKKVDGNFHYLNDNVKRLQMLAKVHEQCVANKYAELQAKYADRPRHEQPAEVCALAARHEELLKQYVPLAAQAFLETRIAEAEAAIKELDEQGWLDEPTYKRLTDLKAYAKELHADFSEKTKEAGTKVPVSAFDGIQTIGPKFKSTLAAAAKKDRFPVKMTTEDATMAKLVADAAKAKKAKLVKLRMMGSSWAVEKNALGVPLRKSNAGSALIQVPGEPFCRGYPHVQFSAAHIGGGKYDPAAFHGFGSSARAPLFQVSRCK